LYRKASEIEPGEVERIEILLAHYDFQLIPTPDDEFLTPFWAHTHPIEPWGCGYRTISLDRNLESLLMQRGNQRRIELQ
jgi:hypothetical protein